MSMSWVPVPTLTLSSSAKDGGRSTSACTSFQPLSSCSTVRARVRVR